MFPLMTLIVPLSLSKMLLMGELEVKAVLIMEKELMA